MDFQEKMTEEQLKDARSNGGKTTAKARKEQKVLREKRKTTHNETLEDALEFELNDNDLHEMAKSLIASGKKGSVKAVEQIVKLLDRKKQVNAQKENDNFDTF